MKNNQEREVLNMIAVILLVVGAILSVIIIGGVANFSNEVKVIWYWIIGILTVAGIGYLILIKK